MWPRAPEPVVACDGEVHVWQLRLDGASQRPGDAALLSDGERARAARFRFDSDRARYVQAHAFLRRVLGRYAGCSPGALVFSQLPDGKPFLDGSDLQFNLAHCRTLALVAVGRTQPLGVDVEGPGAEPVDEGLAATTLCAAELAGWRALAPSERPRAFYRAWTRKEALLKARGEGLATPPDQLDVTGPESQGWTLVDLPLGTDWVGALAVVRPVILRCFAEDGDGRCDSSR